MTDVSLNVAVPWCLSHYVPLDGFHPLYRAFFDHSPTYVTFSAWDNVKLYRKFLCDISLRNTILSKAKTEESCASRLNSGPVAKRYIEQFWPPNQVLTTELMGDIEFHHTAPFPSLKRPFVFHCESFVSVLFPFFQQNSGDVEDYNELRKHYRGILADPLCLGIFSHIPKTLHALSQFFSDPIIDGKLFPSRIGLSANMLSGDKPQQKSSLSRPWFLFMNSANQKSDNFFRRGGHLVLRFWKNFLASGRDGILVLRCVKPSDRELMEYGVDLSFVNAEIGRSIIWAQDYLACHEMNALMANVHFFLLPGTSLHSVAGMEAMSMGALPVVSDMVGRSLYINDNEEGMILHGLEKVIWQKDVATNILVDRHRRTPDLDDSLVAQMTSRVGTLLEDPRAYWDMRARMFLHAKEQFPDQGFAQEFWSTVSDLYARFRRTSSTLVHDDEFERQSLRDCRVQGEAWSRVFESPTQPMRRINAGRGVVWELGSSIIHSYGKTDPSLEDWSVLAQHFSTGPLQGTFVNTIEELEGTYLCSNETRPRGTSRKFIAWISGILKPFPALYRFSATVLSKLRYNRWARFAKPKANPDIELMRQGVSGFNIIRYRNRYYPIPQHEEGFIPNPAEDGAYSSCFSVSSVDHALRYISASVLSSIRFDLDGRSDLSDLILGEFHGFQIFRQGKEFHAIFMNESSLVREKILSKQYSHSFSGFSVNEVQSKILCALNTEQAQTTSLENVRRREGSP